MQGHGAEFRVKGQVNVNRVNSDVALIAASRQQITTDWVNFLLERCGYDDIAIETRVSALNSGLSGTSYRVAIIYSGPATAPASLYVKLPSTDPRVLAVLAPGYRTEILSYQHIIPGLRIAIPECLLAAIDPETSAFTLVLRDAAPARAGDQLAGVSPGALREPIAQLAVMHSRHWELQGLPDADWLSPLYGRPYMQPDIVIPAWLSARQRYVAEFSAAENAFGDWLIDNYAHWLGRLPALYTFVHADFRLENLLLTEEETLAGIVDWQTATAAPGALDVAYLVAGSMSPEARRTCERQLVSAYHTGLLRGGVADFSADECWRHYRFLSLHGVIQILLASFSITGDYSHRLFLALLQRHIAHAVDMKLSELL